MGNIRRWQEEISCYKFILKFVEGESNVWADMLCRGCGYKKVKTCSDPTPTSKTYKLEGSDLHIYIPSWCIGEVDSLQLIPRTHTPQNIHNHKWITNAFFAYHSTSTIPSERIYNHLGIAAEQIKDDAFSKIIRADSPDEIDVVPDDQRAALLRKHLNHFFLEPGTSVLMIRDSNHSPKLAVPYKLRTRYLHQAQEGNNHPGVTRMRELLSNYWWEFKNRDIKSYVDSCDTCVQNVKATTGSGRVGQLVTASEAGDHSSSSL